MARLKDFLPQGENNFAKLDQAFSKGRMHSTFLCVGADELTKKKMILSLAQKILCEKSSSEKSDSAPCGFCPACLRVEKEQHESLLWIVPDKTSIKVEQAHQIMEFLSLQSTRRVRFIIIQEAEKMTVAAANSLLKILEEPSANVHFFLCVPSQTSVLSTIRSRSQVLYFNQSELKIAVPEDLHADSLKVLEKLPEEPTYYLDEEFKNLLGDRSQALTTSLSWTYHLREALVGKNALSDWGASSLAEISGLTMRLEQALQQNRDVQLVFEEFWIESLNILRRNQNARMD